MEHFLESAVWKSVLQLTSLNCFILVLAYIHSAFCSRHRSVYGCCCCCCCCKFECELLFRLFAVFISYLSEIYNAFSRQIYTNFFSTFRETISESEDIIFYIRTFINFLYIELFLIPPF